jgi:hypothetical protein
LARHIADRIGCNFSGAETVKETEWEQEGEEGNCPRVMGVDDRVRSRGRGDSPKPLCNSGQRFVPRYRLESSLALLPDSAQWAGQSNIRIEPLAIIARRALCAQLAAAYGVVWITPDLPDQTVALDNDDPATVVAVTRTSRADNLDHGEYDS